MCGFIGVYNKSLKFDISDSLKLMKHRGPDNTSIYENDYCIVGHNRLSIIDLDEKSNQPFIQDNLILIFNGEIYNYIELRKQLLDRGVKFETKSDTEVVLKYYKIFNKKCVEFFEGMFSFGIYDTKTNSVFVARDRIGEKPLFYHLTNENTLIISSEIKGIISLIGEKEISEKGVFSFLSNSYEVPSPYSIHDSIFKLEPGYSIDFEGNILKKYKYWDLSKIPRYRGSFNDSIEKLNHLLQRSVINTLNSDRKLSIMLSGGVDSSMVSSIGSKYIKELTTYSLGVSDEDEEIKRAYFVSKKLESNHKNVIIPNDLFDNYGTELNRIFNTYDEPFSLIPLTYADILYKKIKEDFTVCLSGNGADEIFGGYYGYNRFFLKFHILSITGRIIKFLKIYKLIKKLERIVFLYGNNDIENLIRSTLYVNISHIIDKHFLSELESFLREYLVDLKDKSIYKKKFFLDLIYSNNPGVVRMTDGIGMRYSIEIRSPFLNHKIVEFMLSLPDRYIIGIFKNRNKRIVKKLAEKYLPNEIVYAKKMGFGYSVGNIFNEKFNKLYNKKIDDSINTYLTKKRFVIWRENKRSKYVLHQFLRLK